QLIVECGKKVSERLQRGAEIVPPGPRPARIVWDNEFYRWRKLAVIFDNKHIRLKRCVEDLPHEVKVITVQIHADQVDVAAADCFQTLTQMNCTVVPRNPCLFEPKPGALCRNIDTQVVRSDPYPFPPAHQQLDGIVLESVAATIFSECSRCDCDSVKNCV